MDTIAVTLGVQPLANAQLRLCVFPADPGHHSTSGFSVEYVCHSARNTGTPARPPLPTEHIVRENNKWPDNSVGLPRTTPRGTLLVFDNGNYQARPFTPAKPPRETYTRAVEYKIDEEKMTVEEIWASEGPGPDSVVTFAMGDVEWLPKTQNVLAAYGFTMMREDVESGKFDWSNPIDLHSWTRLREYKRSDPPEVVWEIVLLDKAEENPVGWSLFGAEHLPSWGR